MLDNLYSYITSQVPLTDEAWHDMQSILAPRQLRKKEHFLRQDEVCKYLGFITEGYVRLYYLVDGVEVTKDFNFENWFCGSLASFSLQQPSRFNIVAMEPVTLLQTSRDNFYRTIDKHPALQKLARLHLERMFIYNEQRETTFLLDTPEQRYRDLLSRQPGILQRIPLKYIASYLGIAPETLSRIRAGSMG
ncbi:Crp/Fnr family transcriptional regulator [Polluticoccus soli]|uniref:Crp/Fnr family transcriptional regulator n=1 Tax=Polluticoccus soli TaxID=3034150 RepID=UPI0023E27D3A|nr:Crp/Fnr family transcriptional regulator [Flavipsychrobacter sp. JY13-12]